MRKQIQYVSELNRAFDTPGEAIEDDKRLPDLIATYERDLAQMENGLKMFRGEPVTEGMKEIWRRALDGYRAKWEVAQRSWADDEVS